MLTTPGTALRNASLRSREETGPTSAITVSIYVSAFSVLSGTPAAAISGLFGIHSPPPDTEVVPPHTSVLSTTSTSSSSSAAVTAAVRAAAPVPTTRTSTIRSQSPCLPEPVFSFGVGFPPLPERSVFPECSCVMVCSPVWVRCAGRRCPGCRECYRAAGGTAQEFSDRWKTGEKCCLHHICELESSFSS
jgi:hypothetical protein